MNRPSKFNWQLIAGSVVKSHSMTRRLSQLGKRRSPSALPVLAWALATAALIAGHVFAVDPPFRHVYVPIEDLDVLFASKKGVLLSRQEFLELWRKANVEGRPGSTAPDDLLLTGGNYVAEVSGDAIKIRGDLDIVKNRLGWQSLQLDFEGVAISTALLNGVPAILGLDNSGRPQLFVRDSGKQRLLVELTAPLTPGVDARSTRFRLPTASGELIFMTKADTEIRLEGAEAPLATNAAKQLRVPLFDRGRVALTVAPTSTAGERKPVLIAYSDSAVSLSPAVADWRESLQLDVAAKSIDVAVVDFPLGWQVVDVESADLTKWDVIPQAASSRLTARFARPWSGKREIKLHAVGVTPLDKSWTLPHVVVANAVQQTGRTELSHDENLAVEVRDLRSARRLSAETKVNSAERFAGWKADYSVSILAKARQSRLSATVATLINVGRSRLEMNSSVTVEPRNGALFELALLVPADWDISGVEAAGKPLAFQRTTANSKTRLDILLPEPVAANKQTTLLIKADRSPDGWLKDAGKTATIDLATVAVVGAAEVEGMLLIRAPGEVRVAAANLSGFESVPVAGIPNADQFVRLALRHRTDIVAGKLESLLRPALVSADIDIIAVVTETHLSADYFVGYRIKQGVTDQLSFELPESIATNEVEVSVLNGAHLESQSVVSVGADRKRWTMKFDRDIDSAVKLRVHIDVPRSSNRVDVTLAGNSKPKGATTPPVAAAFSEKAARPNGDLTALPLLTVSNAVRQTGTVAVEGAFDQQVSVVSKDLRAIDPGELPTLPPRTIQGRLVSAYQFRKPPYELAVRASKHPELTVLTAVCRQARMTSVLDSSGTLRQRAELHIDNVGLQNLSVTLPEHSEMLSTTLDDRPVELRRDNEKYLIALPLATTRTATGNVTIDFLTAVDPLRTGGQFKQKPPMLNVPVVRLDWTLYLPDDQAVVESSGAITPTSPLERDSLIGSIRKALLRRGTGRIFNPFEPLLLLSKASSYGEFDAVTSSIAPGRGVPKSSAPPVGGGQRPSAQNQLSDEMERAPANRVSELARRYESPRSGETATTHRSNLSVPNAPTAAAKNDRVMKVELMPPAGEKGAQPGQTIDIVDGVMSKDKSEFGLLTEKKQAETAGGIGGNSPAQGASNKLRYIRGTGFREASSRGLLSLQMNIDSVGKPVKFLGTTGDGELLIRLVNDRLIGAWTASVAVAVILLGWLTRNWSRPVRAFGVATVLALSLGLSGLAPLGWLFVLDGLFLGALGVWILYIARAICKVIGGRKLAAAAFALVLFGFADRAAAQSETPIKPVADGSPMRTSMPAESADNADELPTIYVPYDAKLDPLKSNQVYLPKDEYQRLWNLANPQNVILPDPAITGTISEVDYSGNLVGNTARFDATMTAWSFRDDWVALKLPVAGAVIGAVTIDGQPAALAGTDHVPAETKLAKANPMEFPTVFVRGRGAHAIVVRFELQAQRAGATGSVSLNLAPVGAAQLRFELPESGMDIQPGGLKSGWTLKGNVVSAAVSTGGIVELRWQPMVKRGEGLVVNLQQRSRVEIGQTGLRQLTDLEYTLRQGSTRRLELSIPDSLLVRSVKGAALTDWFLQGAVGNRRLVLRTNRAISGTQRFSVDSITTFSATDTQTIPELIGLEVHRETGEIVIVADPALEVAVQASSGYQRTGKDTVVAPAESESTRSWRTLAAYRFAGRPALLSLAVSGRSVKLASDIRSTYTVEKERVKITTTVSMSQTGMPLVSARVKLPKEFNLDQITTPTDVRWTVVEDAGGAIVHLEQTGLPDAATDDSTPLPVAIHGWLNRNPARPDVELPAIEVLQSTKQRGEWSIYLAPGSDAETTGLTGLRPIEPSALSSLNGSIPMPRRRSPPRLAFRQESFPAKLQLALRKLTPRVNVDVTTTIGVREMAVVVASRLRFNIEQAGVRTLQLLAPEWLGQDVDLSGFGVRHVESFSAENGKRRFEIGLDREFVGQYELRLTKVFPLPEDGVIRAPQLEPLDVESVRSFVLLENQSSDQLDRIESPGSGIESIEPDALPLAVSPLLRKRVVETLRLSRTSPEPRWKLRTSKPIEGLAASVNLFELTMVVSRDGQYRAQASLRVINRLEQFLPMAFPEGSQIWSVFVSGQPSKPAKGTRDNKPIVLLPLPKTATGDRASIIEVVYTGKIDKEEGALKRWRFPSPRVLGDLPVAKTQWTLYLPKDFDYGFFEGMEEIETGIVELNRQEAELNDIANVLSDYKRGKGSAKQRAYSNLSTWSLAARNDNPVQSDKGREIYGRVQDQSRRVVQELQAIKQQASVGPANDEQIRWVEFYDEFQSKPSDEDAEASDAELRTLEMNQMRQNRRKLSDADTEPQLQQKSQSRARLKGQLESQTAVLNRLQNEGQLGANSSAFGYKIQRQQAGQSPESAFAAGIPQSSLPINPDPQKPAAPTPQVSADDSISRDGTGRPPAEPTARRIGGLSLRIELPTEGKPLNFVKARGEPSLTVVAYQAELSQTGTAAGWLIATCLLSGGLAYGFTHASSVAFLGRNWRWLTTTIGLVWWLALPASAAGFFVFLLGLFVTVFYRIWLRYAHAPSGLTSG